MFRIDLAIELTIQAPFMTQATEPGNYGLDAVMAKNADGDFMIPATLLIGCLRESWEELTNVVSQAQQSLTASIPVPEKSEIKTLLGASSEETDGDFSPLRKRLFFTELVLKNENTETPRVRISIDPERGAASDGMLQVLESPSASGAELVFAGKVSFFSTDHEEKEKIHRQILCGLQGIEQIGALTSIGFGRLVNAVVEEENICEIAVTIDPQSDQTNNFAILLRPSAPFCIAGRPQANNVFVSEEVIPGGVIRGVLAQTIDTLNSGGKLDCLKEQFSKIAVTHAFPSVSPDPNVRPDIRPLHFPLSLVKVRMPTAINPSGGKMTKAQKRKLKAKKESLNAEQQPGRDEKCHDVARLPGPVLIYNSVPAFHIDWKTDDDVKEQFGWPQLSREMRVRTAISRERRRQEDEQLFAYEMIQPGKACWLARVDLSAIEESTRPMVAKQLQAVLKTGLFGIGKNKTSAEVELLPSVKDKFQRGNLGPLQKRGELILTLQSPALLLDPFCLAGVPDSKALHQAYAESWKTLCPLLALERFFARQKLSGGKYQYRRFQQKRPARSDYYPWLLTEAGSVFVFKTIQKEHREEVCKFLSRWLATGLPLPSTAITAYDLPEDIDTQWQCCPYIPQNGYGEIAVNLFVHSDTAFACPENRIERITIPGQGEAANEPQSAKGGKKP